MGRIRPAWYYERQAREANARQTFFANRQPPDEDTTIESRGASTNVFYRSLNLRNGTDHLIFATSVLSANLALLSAAEAGLTTTLSGTDVASRLRGSGVKPTKVHWYRGTANPVRRRTEWNTSVARYYDTQGGRSHYSVPFCRASGVFDGDDLIEAFNGLFGPSGTRRALLGPANGRAYLEMEKNAVSATT